MNVYLPNLRLPSTYQEVEYIESSGTQCIDTGYKPSSNTEVESKLSITTIPKDSYIYGCRNGDSGTSRRTFCLGAKTATNKFYSFVYTNLDSNYEKPSINTISTNTIYTLKQNDTALYLDGILQGSYPTHSSYTVGYNMYIFRGNIAGTQGNAISMKLYSMKIRDNGTLVRHFIPCYRKSDNVIGLYNLVNNQFYTNAGSGTFSKGNDVTMAELKNAYIGEVIHPTLPPDENVQGSTIYYTPIAKTGYNIKQITIQGKGKFNNYSGNTANTCGFFPKISSAANRTYETGLAINLKLNSTTNDNWYGYRSNNTNVKDYTFPDSWFNNTLYGINEFTIVATKTGWSANINGNTYSKNYGTTMASVVSSIFNSSTAQAAVNTNGGGTFIELTYAIEYEN